MEHPHKGDEALMELTWVGTAATDAMALPSTAGTAEARHDVAGND